MGMTKVFEMSDADATAKARCMITGLVTYRNMSDSTLDQLLGMLSTKERTRVKAALSGLKKLGIDTTAKPPKDSKKKKNVDEELLSHARWQPPLKNILKNAANGSLDIKQYPCYRQ